MSLSNQHDHILRRAATQKTDEFLGKRHCKSCHTFQNPSGGSESKDSKGRPKWLCAGCVAKVKARRNASHGVAALAAPVVPAMPQPSESNP
jgi:hypothetical protein